MQRAAPAFCIRVNPCHPWPNPFLNPSDETKEPIKMLLKSRPARSFRGMRFLAPAKINLSLRVLGKRPDGFHEIQSLMTPLSLADEIDIERQDSGGIAFTCDDPLLPTGEANLAYRAAKLFCERGGFAPDLSVALKKKVPHGAGLGGGSSDAAAVLLGLNKMFEAGLTREALAALAAELGSDVPFFIWESAALCRGRGETVSPVALEEGPPLVLLKPPFGVPTPWAYSRWRDAKEIPGIPYAAQVFPWGELVNDLERPVFEKYIFLAFLKRWLLAQPETAGALMSGSGSTVFALARDEPGAAALERRAGAEFEGLWTCVCKMGRP